VPPSPTLTMWSRIVASAMRHMRQKGSCSNNARRNCWSLRPRIRCTGARSMSHRCPTCGLVPPCRSHRPLRTMAEQPGWAHGRMGAWGLMLSSILALPCPAVPSLALPGSLPSRDPCLAEPREPYWTRVVSSCPAGNASRGATGGRTFFMLRMTLSACVFSADSSRMVCSRSLT